MFHGDPHDDLLLTERPTTIVTQATMANDSMPTPYGTQEDEDALFSEVGNDHGFGANADAVEAASASTQNRVPTVARAPSANAAVIAEETKAAGKSLLVIVGLGLGLGWLFSRR